MYCDGISNNLEQVLLKKDFLCPNSCATLIPLVAIIIEVEAITPIISILEVL